MDEDPDAPATPLLKHMAVWLLGAGMVLVLPRQYWAAGACVLLAAAVRLVAYARDRRSRS